MGRLWVLLIAFPFKRRCGQGRGEVVLWPGIVVRVEEPLLSAALSDPVHHNAFLENAEADEEEDGNEGDNADYYADNQAAVGGRASWYVVPADGGGDHD